MTIELDVHRRESDTWARVVDFVFALLRARRGLKQRALVLIDDLPSRVGISTVMGHVELVVVLGRAHDIDEERGQVVVQLGVVVVAGRVDRHCRQTVGVGIADADGEQLDAHSRRTLRDLVAVGFVSGGIVVAAIAEHDDDATRWSGRPSVAKALLDRRIQVRTTTELPEQLVDVPRASGPRRGSRTT